MMEEEEVCCFYSLYRVLFWRSVVGSSVRLSRLDASFVFLVKWKKAPEQVFHIKNSNEHGPRGASVKNVSALVEQRGI